MYPLIFLNDRDIDDLKRHLELSVQTWVKSYTFSSEVVVEISRVKLHEFINRAGSIAYLDENNRIPTKICTNDFNWQHFIFGDQLKIVPTGSKLNTLTNTLKALFFKDVFNVDIDESQHSDSFVSSIDAHLHVRVSSLEIGSISFFASHAFFASVTGKEEKYSRGATLASREEAVKQVKIPISFSLGFGNIPFSSLLKADKGTVFESDIQLENNFSMAICASRVAVASMGRKSGNLAFLLKSKDV